MYFILEHMSHGRARLVYVPTVDSTRAAAVEARLDALRDLSPHHTFAMFEAPDKAAALAHMELVNVRMARFRAANTTVDEVEMMLVELEITPIRTTLGEVAVNDRGVVSWTASVTGEQIGYMKKYLDKAFWVSIRPVKTGVRGKDRGKRSAQELADVLDTDRGPIL